MLFRLYVLTFIDQQEMKSHITAHFSRSYETILAKIPYKMSRRKKEQQKKTQGRTKQDMLHIDIAKIEKFRDEVYTYYTDSKRELPWRETDDPWHILVSEIMLQQTQVSRVIDKYTAFIEAFPTAEALHTAEKKDVLAAWSGLGYNRRALSLMKAAHVIAEKFDGKVPATIEELSSLPGIGQATAAAICAYAFNQPVIYIETNIRTVFIHHFFPGNDSVSDKEILPLVTAALDHDNPRRWYSALMDYGVMLKAKHKNPGRRSAHHNRQSKFEGSDRQIRGAILKLLTNSEGGISVDQLIESCANGDRERCLSIVEQLQNEGFVNRKKRTIHIA